MGRGQIRAETRGCAGLDGVLVAKAGLWKGFLGPVKTLTLFTVISVVCSVCFFGVMVPKEAEIRQEHELHHG